MDRGKKVRDASFHSNQKGLITMKFIDINPKLSQATLDALTSFHFEHATPVQAATIPLFLKNKDVCVDATTGSGKTLAFAIPIFEMLARVSPALGEHDVGALVVSPTRELAMQIYEVLAVFSQHHHTLQTVHFVGGTSVSQDASLYTKQGGQVIICTPGRILDLKTRLDGIISFRRLEVLVLDEADKLLDMGFKDAVNQILSILPKQRRTGLFSATQTKEVKELVRAGLRNPVVVAVTVQQQQQQEQVKKQPSQQQSAGSQNNTQIVPTSLKNWYLVRNYDERLHTLLHFLLSHLKEKVIVFCATCACVDYYAAVFHQLTRSEYAILPSSYVVVGFHGKMPTKKRTLCYRRFKALEKQQEEDEQEEKKNNSGKGGGIMFSTDVAARGIDIPDVDWIIQLTAPKDPAFFVHRVGRTARAGRIGQALLFLANHELPYLDLLRGRGVPLNNADIDNDNDNNNNNEEEEETSEEKKSCMILSYDHKIDYHISRNDYHSRKIPYRPCYDILNIFKHMAKYDRDILEMGSAAFVAFLRAYTEHLCSYIFRLAELDIGAVARSYALLRLPKMAETRGVKGKPILFDTDPTNTATIAYRNESKESARLKRLQAAMEEEEEEEDLEDDDKQVNVLGGVRERKTNAEDADSDNALDGDASDDSDDNNHDKHNKVGDSSDDDEVSSVHEKATVRTTKTSLTNKSGKIKVAWIPAERYQELVQEKLGNKNIHPSQRSHLKATADGDILIEKRQRKRKQSFVQKFKADWDDIAGEEALFRKFKKGKISKEEYEEKLTSLSKLSDGDEDDDDDDDDEPAVSRSQRRKQLAASSAASTKKIDYRNKKKRHGGR